MKILAAVFLSILVGCSYPTPAPPDQIAGAHWKDVSYSQDGKKFNLVCSSGLVVGNITTYDGKTWWAQERGVFSGLYAEYESEQRAAEALVKSIITNGDCR